MSYQHLLSVEAITSSKGYIRSLIVSTNHGFKSIASPFLHIDTAPPHPSNGNQRNTTDKKFPWDNNHHNNHRNDYNHSDNKLPMDRSIYIPQKYDFMDQLTITATQSGHRLNAYLLKLLTVFHHDLRSTSDTFELLMRYYDDENGCCGGLGLRDPTMTNASHPHTNKSSSPLPSSPSSQRILENPQRLERLHEYLIVVRFLLIQTSASLLTTMDNIVIIKASADAYQKSKENKNHL